MIEIVQVKLREGGNISYYNTNNLRLEAGMCVILEADRGIDYGEVISEPEVVLESDIQGSLGKIIRIANRHDIEQIKENKKRIRGIFKACERKIAERGMDMKLVDAEYSLDNSKIIFYFTAEGRVDFRELVKELAGMFKARIELKQIGVRDEARMLGGFGICGRPLCCTRFLKDFSSITIRMAKEQNLPLNPSKISGLCGRLMCCLEYEHPLYKELSKDLPKPGRRIKIKQEMAKVISINPLAQTVMVELDDGRQMEVSVKTDK